MLSSPVLFPFSLLLSLRYFSHSQTVFHLIPHRPWQGIQRGQSGLHHTPDLAQSRSLKGHRWTSSSLMCVSHHSSLSRSETHRPKPPVPDLFIFSPGKEGSIDSVWSPSCKDKVVVILDIFLLHHVWCAAVQEDRSSFPQVFVWKL